MADFLPDSRPRRSTGAIRSPHGTLIPIYCAQCGKPWGRVREELITFAFALCDPCSETMGAIAHTYKEPDSIFWKRVEEAQREDFGKILSLEELTKALADPTSSLSKLAEEWQAQVRKTQK